MNGQEFENFIVKFCEMIYLLNSLDFLIIKADKLSININKFKACKSKAFNQDMIMCQSMCVFVVYYYAF